MRKKIPDSDDEDRILTAGGTEYDFDADGFLERKTDGSGVTEYAYSSRGELLRADLPDGRRIEYIHDPLGRRIAKRVDGTVTEKYLWQGLTRLLAVYDGNNNLLMRFEYADSRMPVAMTAGGATYYLAYDQVGSLKAVSDSSGNVLLKREYDSFGNILDEEGTPPFGIPFGFAGGLYDRDTGLVRFGYRDYDPEIGRWTAKDPILFSGGNTDLYGYCMSNPVNFIDPPGLESGSLVGNSYDSYAKLHGYNINHHPKAEFAIPQGTLGIDLSATLGGGKAMTAGYTGVIDSNLNIALIEHAGGGGLGGAAAGVAAQIQVTNAPDIYALTGESVSTGGSYGTGVQATSEWTVMPGGYHGVNAGISAGPGTSIELHSVAEHSRIIWESNLFDIVGQVCP
ncbi:RHS repeat domain-containing protein [Desulfonema magnum]|uniref:RHS repeat-associated core domain-containing protein n=1 Tax=Desulfonema magnum TaxID=45655 RepID=A0A975BF32_9BACT|nr:RHS repeat-associated core domain-containing protein [Desulfonema magnum]QTA84138.1 RHS repeat-associated core domain-containing protein [Desulfonema magnum]